MLGVEALATYKVMFATPIYGGGQPIYIAGLWALSGDCVKVGMETCLKLHPDADPIRGRTMILSQFLADDRWTHLFWIDSDIMATTAQVFRLLLVDRDIAVGVPPIKQYPMTYPFFPIDGNADDDGFCRTHSAVTGFMCIKRSTILKMIEKYPELKLKNGGWRLFDNMICPTTGDYLTEDYAFCRRWTDMGGEIHADVHSKLGHSGQHIFQGDLGKHLGFDG